MRIEDLRIGNYVDVVLKENNTTIRCKVQRINHDDKSAVFKDMTNGSEFLVDTEDKWKLVKDVVTTANELTKLGFNYDSEMSVYMLPTKGAWYIGKAIVQKYNGRYDLFIEKNDAFYGCKAIAVPGIHFLQNALADYYGINID